MKKLFLSLTAAVGLTSMVATAAAPEAYYLVGSMTSWATPADGATTYALLDEDGDGVYTGTYDLTPCIPNAWDYDIFYVFVGVSSWDDVDSIYGRQDDQAQLLGIFSDRTNKFSLTKYNDGGSQNIVLGNEGNGPVTISCKLDDNGEMEMQVTAPGWTKAPTPPEEIYLVGDFNDWQFPSGSNSNGALVFRAEDEENPGNFVVSKNFEAGDVSFGLAYKANANANVYYAIPPLDEVPFTVLNRADGSLKRYYYTYTVSSGAFKRKGQKFNIRDFHGGNLTFEINTDLNECTYYSESAPALNLPDNMYAVITADGGEPELIQMWNSDSKEWVTHSGNTQIISFKGRECSVFFTSENSTNPADDKIWGFADDASISKEFTQNSFIKGGKPLNISFDSRTKVKMMLYVYENIITSTTETDIRDLPYIYLNGYQVNWPTPTEANADQLIKIENNGNGVFEGEIECPYQEPNSYGESNMQFRFFTGLEGWTYMYSLGSALEDFYCYNVYMDETPRTYDIIEQGLGNWGLCNWDGGRVKLSVDLNNMKLTISDASAAVEQVETDSTDTGEAIYYNMQGMRVDGPVKGLVIKTVNGKATKMIVK